jgi:hypothetical protein
VLIFTGKVSKLSTTFVSHVSPKSIPFEVRIKFSDDLSFRTDSVPKGKTEPKQLAALKVSPNLEGSQTILILCPSDSLNSVLELNFIPDPKVNPSPASR